MLLFYIFRVVLIHFYELKRKDFSKFSFSYIFFASLLTRFKDLNKIRFKGFSLVFFSKKTIKKIVFFCCYSCSR